MYKKPFSHFRESTPPSECKKKVTYVTLNDGHFVDSEINPIPQDVNFRVTYAKSAIVNGVMGDRVSLSSDGISNVDAVLNSIN